MTDLDTRRPEFAVGMRGYDRIQVDEYIDRLQNMLREAELRAHSAESGDAFSAHRTVGPRVSEIFELAEAEANEVCEQIKQQATEMRAKAQSEAERMMSTARRGADKAAAKSRKQHQTLVDELEQERVQLREHVAQLEQRKAALLDDLRRIHEALGSVAGLAPPMAGGLTQAPENVEAAEVETTVERVPLREAAA
jgi:DivIVA domain-containing protein